MTNLWNGIYMDIRNSTAAELNDIQALHRQAFGEAEGEIVSKLALDLIEQEESAHSWVATDSGGIIGHLLFSPVKIVGSTQVDAVILAPLAVTASKQKQGVGRQLVEHCLKALTAEGVQAVFVLGDPAYYGRFGFNTKHQVSAPYPLPYPEAWQALELTPDVLSGVTGKLECVATLMAPELW